MPLTLRPYHGEEDYWRIRAFLREVFLRNDRHELSWQAARLDYCRWHIITNIARYWLEDYFFLWEDAGGRLAAVLHPEDLGDAFLQIHPDLRERGLVDEMLDTAEARLSVARPGEPRRLTVAASRRDPDLGEALSHRGYEPGSCPEHQRRRPMDVPIPAAPLPPGYGVRALGGIDELPARSLTSFRAFHPGEPEAGHDMIGWYLNLQRAPLYRRELDLVVVAPDGELAGFCTVWFDDVTRTGLFEPVGIAPAHQRRGLGKAVVCEGLRRAARLGATLCTLGSYTPAAHATYAAVGFTEFDLCEAWSRAW
ncbi:MAG: GNAT family N-acetyltransferase [Chloroflexales bacterium]|nr:GNAT family N-acetyltransferase [Chloroflexales bacterium]